MCSAIDSVRGWAFRPHAGWRTIHGGLAQDGCAALGAGQAVDEDPRSVVNRE